MASRRAPAPIVTAELRSDFAPSTGDPPDAPEPCHELRMRVPADLHRQLLALKILRGVTLADSVALALDRYFAQRTMPAVAELGGAAKRP